MDTDQLLSELHSETRALALSKAELYAWQTRKRTRDQQLKVLQQDETGQGLMFHKKHLTRKSMVVWYPIIVSCPVSSCLDHS